MGRGESGKEASPRPTNKGGGAVGGARESPAASGTRRDGAGRRGAGRQRSRRTRSPLAGARLPGEPPGARGRCGGSSRPLPGGCRRRGRGLGVVGLFFLFFFFIFSFKPLPTDFRHHTQLCGAARVLARRCAKVGLGILKVPSVRPACRPVGQRPRPRGREVASVGLVRGHTGSVVFQRGPAR